MFHPDSILPAQITPSPQIITIPPLSKGGEVRRGCQTLGELLGKTEAYVAPARRVAAVTIRRATVRRVVEPTASAIHAARTRQRASWIRLRGTAIVTTAVPVLTPLPYVATHVIKSQLVWFIIPFMINRLKLVSRNLLMQR